MSLLTQISDIKIMIICIQTDFIHRRLDQFSNNTVLIVWVLSKRYFNFRDLPYNARPTALFRKAPVIGQIFFKETIVAWDSNLKVHGSNILQCVPISK